MIPLREETTRLSGFAMDGRGYLADPEQMKVAALTRALKEGLASERARAAVAKAAAHAADSRHGCGKNGRHKVAPAPRQPSHRFFADELQQREQQRRTAQQDLAKLFWPHVD